MQTQAYFQDIQSQILEELEKAKEKIFVAVAWFTDKELFNMLCKKASSGVTVELMILNDNINNNSNNDYNRLENAGGKLYKIGQHDSRSLMHNKFCVIDYDIVINGSYNWSYNAKQNHENITVSTQASELAFKFETEFKRLKEIYFKTGHSTLSFDIGKIIKRLALIKSLIDLEDTEDIPLQISRLKQYQYEENLNKIITSLTTRQYGTAIKQIDSYIQRHQGITLYIDTEINALKLEAKSLEIQLQALSNEKMEMEKLVFNFNVRHAQELGPLIKEILKLKKLKANNADEKKQAEYNEKEYNQEYESQKDVIINKLTEEEKIEIKKAYREASKLCHPDAVIDKDKEKAALLFIELNFAYEHNDLKKVEHLLNDLRTGSAFSESSSALSRKDQLLFYVENLRRKIDSILGELALIKESKEYQVIVTIANWDNYFIDLKKKLLIVLKNLEDE